MIASVSARVCRRFIILSIRSLMCWSGMSRYGTTFGDDRQGLVQLVGEVVRVVVEDADPVDPLDLVELAEQLGEPGPAVEVDAVIGHVLGDEVQLADAVGGQLAGLLDDLLDRLGDVLAAHVGDRAEGAEPVAPLGDLEVGEVPRA